ncbi:hypothetical protein [Cellulomonas sp. P5_C5]
MTTTTDAATPGDTARTILQALTALNVGNERRPFDSEPPAWLRQLIGHVVLLTTGSPLRYIAGKRDGARADVVVYTDDLVITAVVADVPANTLHTAEEITALAFPRRTLTAVAVAVEAPWYTPLDSDDQPEEVSLTLTYAEQETLRLPLNPDAPSERRALLALRPSLLSDLATA